MGFFDKVGDFFSDAGEFIVDVFTGGVSREARESLDSIEDTTEKAGAAIGLIAATIETLGEDLDKLITEGLSPLVEDAGDLLSVERLTPRDEADLFDEEKERLDDLNGKREVLTGDIDAKRSDIMDSYGVDIPGVYGVALEVWILQNVYSRSWFGAFDWDIFGIDFGGDDIWDMLGKEGRDRVREIQRMNSEIIKIDNEIHAILYNEPGVVPAAIYNTKNILERFNTIEQPKIEDVLDSLDDNLEEYHEIAEQVTKLFVIKKKIAVAEIELTGDKKGRLEKLKNDYSLLENALAKDVALARELMEIKSGLQPETLGRQMPDEYLFDAAKDLKKDLGEAGVSKGLIDAFEGRGLELSKEAKVKTEGAGSWRISDEGKEYVIRESDKDLKVYSAYKGPAVPGTMAGRIAAEAVKAGVTLGPNVDSASRQAAGVKMGVSLGSKYNAYSEKYALQKAVIALREKDLSKLKKEIEKIEYTEIEEPGVIPQTLERFDDILERFNTEEQPRIDAILDSVNENLVETKTSVKNFNTAFERLTGFVDRHTLLLKIFAGVAGVCVILTMILTPVLLIKLIIWG